MTRDRFAAQGAETLVLSLWKARPKSHFEFELAFFGHTFERFARILDPILIIVAIGRQQPNHLVAATGAGAADWARGVEHGLTDLKFVRAQRRS